MNHNDKQKNFGRELKLFDNIIKCLESLYQDQNASVRSVINEEGGNIEMFKMKNNVNEIIQKEAMSDASSDITQKTVSDIRPNQQRKINIRKLRKP